MIYLPLQLPDYGAILSDQKLVLLKLLTLSLDLLHLLMVLNLVGLARCGGWINKVSSHYILNLAGSGSILECVKGLLISCVELTNASKHDCFRVAT